MAIFLHNTLSGKKEEFKPINPGEVGMYNCGPTVYDYLHIGHLRTYTLADLLRRLFETEGYKVKQVINITDVGHLTGDTDDGEDKMEIQAKSEGKKASDLAKFFTNNFFEELKNLNIKTDDTQFLPASEHIPEQIELIERLEKYGHAYKTSDGMYFDTSTFPEYGKLGNINLDGLEEGARIGKNLEKRNPTDFAVWKFSKPEDKRQQEWDSPWGVGFPGWHIECSAMCMKYLGETFDVHTGGIDHIPTHHNNEIAQSESVTKKPLAHFWLHGAFVNINGTKISKSLKNGIRLSELIDKGIHPLSVKYWYFTSHYSTHTNFTNEAVLGADTAYKKIISFLKEAKASAVDGSIDSDKNINENYKNKFSAHMTDDLDTPKAIAVMWEMIKDDSLPAPVKYATLLYFDRYLGLDFKTESEKSIDIPENVSLLIKEREEARKNKDWSSADELRKKILDLGFEIKDGDNGPEIIKK